MDISYVEGMVCQMASQQSVSTLSIVFMSISAALSILVPIGAVIFMGIKKRLNWKAMLCGALLFFIFVMILENLMHVVVLGSDLTKSPIYKNPILYMIYGGFAAGIFEETARLLGFKFLIKVGKNESIDTGISYGLGHGGIEAILIGGLTAVGNLITSVMLNSGVLNSMTGTMNSEELESFNRVAKSLSTTPPDIFLVSGIERLIALVLQIALSLFVLKAAAEKKWLYFIYAILIHAGVDMLAILFQTDIIRDIYVLEALVLLATAAAAIIAFRISKRKPLEDLPGVQ